MVLKLWVGQSGRGNKVLVAAKYNNVNVEVPSFNLGTDNKTPEFLKKNPTGKVPVLETEEGCIFESNAIMRYIARAGGKLYGKNAFEQGLIDQWMDFAANEIELPASAWLYPIFGLVANNPLATKKAQEDIKKVFGILDSHLVTRTFFVGNTITLADISLFFATIHLYKTVLDPAFRKETVNVNRWFTTIANQANVKAVVGEVTLADKVSVAQAAPKKEKAAKEEKPKQEQKPKEEKKPKAKAAEEDEGEEDFGDKEEKKPNPLDALPKSTFVMDEWKRMYSNNDTRSVALPWFFQNVDLAGYSLFFCKYKYNNELTKIFMTSNLIGGFFQRLEKLHKYAFGTMLILGDEPAEGNNGMEIEGAWLFRGTEIPAGMLECDDSEHYDWTRVDLGDASQKKFLEDLWAWDGELRGKKFQAGKTFK